MFEREPPNLEAYLADVFPDGLVGGPRRVVA
jgi:hypothetical protein